MRTRSSANPATPTAAVCRLRRVRSDPSPPASAHKRTHDPMRLVPPLPSKAAAKRIARAIFLWNLISCLAWAILIIPTLLWWKNSLLWVAIMSVYANFAASLAALTASLADPHTDA